VRPGTSSLKSSEELLLSRIFNRAVRWWWTSGSRNRSLPSKRGTVVIIHMSYSPHNRDIYSIWALSNFYHSYQENYKILAKLYKSSSKKIFKKMESKEITFQCKMHFFLSA
jgi:hypothetical protein